MKRPVQYFFAGIALWLMWLGHLSLGYRFWIGAGISLYGIIYFIFQDRFIHNRFQAFKTNNKYLLNIRGRIKFTIVDGRKCERVRVADHGKKI